VINALTVIAAVLQPLLETNLVAIKPRKCTKNLFSSIFFGRSIEEAAACRCLYEQKAKTYQISSLLEQIVFVDRMPLC